MIYKYICKVLLRVSFLEYSRSVKQVLTITFLDIFTYVLLLEGRDRTIQVYVTNNNSRISESEIYNLLLF
jgi:hypothetical protein